MKYVRASYSCVLLRSILGFIRMMQLKEKAESFTFFYRTLEHVSFLLMKCKRT